MSGEVIAENGAPTDARPGTLIRGRQARSDRMSRVAPLAPPWSEVDAAGINSWGHPDRTYEPLLLVRCLQRHPALAAKLRTLGEALYVDTKLPPRVRTIAILRICALVGCAYEWGGQASFWGPIANVSEAECDALVTDAEADWSEDERVLIDAVDELERTGSWSTEDLECVGEQPVRRTADGAVDRRGLVSDHLHALQRP